MTTRFVPPPNWPSLPPGWRPPKGWEPDPRWGPPPPGWQLWQKENLSGWFIRHKVLAALLAAPLALVVTLFGLSVMGTLGSSAPNTFAQPAPLGQVSGMAAPSSPAEDPAGTQQSSSLAADGGKAHPEAKARAGEAAKKKAATAALKAKAVAAKEKAARARAVAAKEKAAKEKAAKEKAAKARAVAARAKTAKEKAAKARAAAAKEKADQERAEEDEETSGDCTPGYSPCLPSASDYDCAGGSGNGPKYVAGPVRVSGSDPYDLDRDGDGTGCDS